MKNVKKGEINMDIKIEKENAFSIIIITKQFNEETSFENVPKFWDEYYEKGYQNVVPPMLGICINNTEGLEFEYGIGSLKDYCNEVPEGFKQIDIPEHLWGKFYTKGKMPTTIQKLWKEVVEWIHSSEYEIAANYDFECYSEGDSDSDDYVRVNLRPYIKANFSLDNLIEVFSSSEYLIGIISLFNKLLVSFT